jgi:hypothetical protein
MTSLEGKERFLELFVVSHEGTLKSQFRTPAGREGRNTALLTVEEGV